MKPPRAAAFDHVDYKVLDKAKNAFIAASRKTLGFARQFGFLPNKTLGASANIFQLPLKPFLKAKAEHLSITLLPEGLGTADDARPDDLTRAQRTRFWRSMGLKTVAVMTNDAAASGMQPILLSLYLPSADPSRVFDAAFMKGFLGGFVEGCRQVRCVYFSGETPQLKNKIMPGKLDIAGALFGLVPPGRRAITSGRLKAGDFIVLVQSSGPHENGFTLLRKLAERLPKGYRTLLPSGRQYWEAISEPSVLYAPLVQDILAQGIWPTNIEPITGHGWQKLMRPKQNFRYRIHTMPPVPEVFSFVEKHTGLTPARMITIFNYGAGCAIFLRTENEARRVVALAKKRKLKAVVAGRVEAGRQREVVVEPLAAVLKGKTFTLRK